MEMSRINELMASMNSFGKEAYHKSELLDEMFALQREIVTLTFNEDHATTSDLKIWDVERHLEQMNQNCENIADEELKRFKSGSKKLCNLIKAEISGNRGEYKAFRTLDYLHTDHIILKNIELKDGDLRTELDAVVITPYGITIVEVKNTAKNIFIDENGSYYRTGQYLKWDCNIAQKMDVKEELLVKALASQGIENVEINKVVVFTDNRIEIQNKYTKIHTCFVSQLPYLIDGFKSQLRLTFEEMENIEKFIKNADYKEAYPFGFDVQQYKTDFATLMALLEEASAKLDDETVIEEVVEEEKSSKTCFKDVLKSIFESRFVKYAGSAAAGVAVSMIANAMISSIRK